MQNDAEIQKEPLTFVTFTKKSKWEFICIVFREITRNNFAIFTVLRFLPQFQLCERRREISDFKKNTLLQSDANKKETNLAKKHLKEQHTFVDKCVFLLFAKVIHIFLGNVRNVKNTSVDNFE